MHLIIGANAARPDRIHGRLGWPPLTLTTVDQLYADRQVPLHCLTRPPLDILSHAFTTLFSFDSQCQCLQKFYSKMRIKQ